ncbi:cysteine desulfurase, partial [Ruminococcaceae bacterium OttesenSCG-928-D13]|nr:cysteine desulfurase [Ruminococcaceae bacterium OttesenSCG-928-D13]
TLLITNQEGGDIVIYADNAATTRVSDIAYERMLPYLQEHYGNASSQYSLGIKAKHAIEQSRQQVAKAINAEASEIIFTSGGSEANSWALMGIANLFEGETIHVITSSIEHHSVINTCHTLENKGVEVTYLPVSKQGVVEIESLKAALQPNTKFVSIMLANNEIGTLQPIAELGRYLGERGILFHTDAVQAVGHIPVDINELHVDFLSASAHKFNGAKGTGFLFKRSGLPLKQLIFGGEQEYALRAGTENVAGIVALGYALEESVSAIQDTYTRTSSLVKLTTDKLKECIPNIIINGEGTAVLPGMVNITFPRTSGEAIMHLLDLKGICVSTSSACNAGKDTPSHVLLALGLTEQQAKSSIRISFGKYNTFNEAKIIAEALCSAYSKINAHSV